MSLEICPAQNNGLLALSQSHGVLCPCGGCRTLFSGGAGSIIPLFGSDVMHVGAGGDAGLISPPVHEAADKLGLSENTQARICGSCIAQFGITDGLAINAALIDKIAHLPTPQRAKVITTLNRAIALADDKHHGEVHDATNS